MDRDYGQGLRYIPTCPRNIAVVDQYMWPEKDTNKYMCQNGISHPIYDCKGMVSYSLPLEFYPPSDRIHPQIEMTRRMHMPWRTSPYHEFHLPSQTEQFSFLESDSKLNRTEGFYSDVPNSSGRRQYSSGAGNQIPYGTRRANRYLGLIPGSEAPEDSVRGGDRTPAPYSQSETTMDYRGEPMGVIRESSAPPVGYRGPLPAPGMYIASYHEPGYPLPNPNGTRGCSSCGCGE
jgi:hypothetical protein